MADRDTHIRWIHDVIDRASAKSRAISASVMKDVAVQDAALQKSLQSQIRASTTREQLALRERRQWRELSSSAGRADREIARSAGTAASAVDKAALKQVEALRATGATYREIAVAARKHGATVSATAAAIEHAAGREAAAIERAAAREKAAHEQVAAARAKAQASTASARSSAAGFVGGMARRATATAGVAASFGVYASARQTIDFDREMRNANALAQLGERAYARLSARTRDLAAETAQMPRTIAEGLGTLIGSGFEANESLLILRSSAKAATAGLTDTGTSTAAVAAVLNAYRLRASDAASVSDTLFRTVDQGVIRFETLAQNIGDVLPFAASLGIGLDQVGASVATMTKAGISGPETMTRIKAVMTALIKPSEDLSKEIRRQGFESAEAMLKARGFQGTLDDIAESTGGSKQRLATMFRDVRALGGALALTGRNSATANRDVRSLADSSGAMNQALSQQAQSVSYQWDRLKATSAALAIEVGTELVPAMTDAIQAGTDFAQQFFAGAMGKRPLGGIVTDAYELGEAVREIGDTAGPIVQDLAEMASEAASFVGHNPELRRLVAMLVAAGVAVKAIKFAGAITGVNQLVTGVGRLQRTGVLGRAGASTSVAGGSRFAGLRGTGMAVGGTGLAVGGALAGSAIGGSAGSIVSGAGAGAGIGMLAGPWGAAAGAVVGGIGTAIVEGLTGSARREAEEAAREAAADIRRRTEEAMAGGIRRPTATANAAAGRRAFDANAELRDAQERLADMRRNRGTRALSVSGGPRSAAIPGARTAAMEQVDEEIAAQIRRIRALGGRARSATASVMRSLRSGWRGFQLLDSNTLERDFVAATEGLPLRARAAAAKTLLEMARQWERSGRLPRGSVRRLRNALALDIDGLGEALEKAGAPAGRNLGRALDRGLRGARVRDRVNRTIREAADAVSGLPRRMGRDLPQATAILAGSIQEMEGRIRQLTKQTRTGTRAQRDAAQGALDVARGQLDKMRGAYARALDEMTRQYGVTARAAERWATRTGEAVRNATSGRAAQIDELSNAVARLKSELQGMPSSIDVPDFAPAATAPIPGLQPPGRRTGGTVLRFQAGGLVPVMVSSGEELVHGDQSWMVPGPRVAADNVFAMVPSGTEVYTEHGQSLLAAGASRSQALAEQMPHFATGGVVDRFRRGGRAAGWKRIGATTFDDPPPGAFGMNLSGYAELGTATRGGTGTGRGWLARAFGLPGELPENFKVDFMRNGQVVTLPKRDRGYGQGGDGTDSDPNYQADFWRSTGSKIGAGPGFKGTVMARPHDGRYGSYSYMRPPVITHSREVDLLQPYGALDAFGQGFTSGLEGTRRIFRNWRGLDTDLFAAATSGVRANARDLPKKVTVRGASAATAKLKGATPRQRAIASKIVAGAGQIVGLPYTYGGHGNPGYDCSSAVLYALNRGGLSSASGTTDTLKGWGKGGSGRYLTVGVRGTSGKQAHTMMSVAGLFFESGGSSGAGVHWASGWNGSFPIKRTWPGMRSGGVAGRKRPQIPVASSVRGRFRPNDARLDPRDPAFVGWGMRAGGVVPRFRGGGVTGSLIGRRAVGVGRGPASGSVRQIIGPLAQPIQVIGAEGARADDVIEEMRELGGLLQAAGEVSYRRIGRLRAGMHDEIRGLMKGGETGRERIQIRRLRGVLTLLEAEMGKRTGLVLKRAQDALDAVDTRETRTSQRLALGAVDEGSVQGLGALRRTDLRSQTRLSFALRGRDGQGGPLLDALRRAQRMRDADAVRTIREAIRANRERARELTVGIVTRSRELMSTRVQDRVDNIDERFGAAQRIRTNAERGLAVRGIDTGTAAGMFTLRDADVRRQGEMERALGSQRDRTGLYAELDKARRARNKALARSIQDTISTYSDEIAQLGVDIQVASREAAAQARREQVEQIRNAASAQVEAGAWQTGIFQTQMQRFEIGQQMAELQGGPRFDSRQARDARASYITSTIVPSLQNELARIEEQVRAAEQTRADEGGEEAWRAAQAAREQKLTEIAQSQLEAAQEGNRKADEQTDALRQLGGTTSFGFQSQRFSDIVNAGVGA